MKLQLPSSDIKMETELVVISKGHDSRFYPIESWKKEVALSGQRGTEGEEDVGREGREGGTAPWKRFSFGRLLREHARCLLPRFAR